MTPRIRLSTIVLGLAAGPLLSGCARPFLNTHGSGAPMAGAAGLLAAQVGVTGRVSPYHPLPAAVLAGVPVAKNPTVEPAHCPDPPVAEPEPVPPPALLVEHPEHQPPAPPAPVPAAAPIDLHPGQRPEEALLEAMRYVLQKRPEEAVELLRRYDTLNQDMLLGLLGLAVRLTHGSLDRASPEEVSVLLEQLNSQAVLLRPRAALSIEKMCCCRDIQCFGGYDPLPEDHQFQAGKEGRPGEQVLLYVELRNFAIQPRGPCYETELATRLEICDRGGGRIWVKDFPAEQPDRSHTQRHDYFIAYRFSVPPHLPVGDYMLGVEVRDLTGLPSKEVPPHRMARRSLFFRVTSVGDPRRPSPAARPASPGERGR